MEEPDFVKIFTNIDQLQAQAVAKIIGVIVAALYNGMLEGGMSDGQAGILIGHVFKVFMEMMNEIHGGQDQ